MNSLGKQLLASATAAILNTVFDRERDESIRIWKLKIYILFVTWNMLRIAVLKITKIYLCNHV